MALESILRNFSKSAVSQRRSNLGHGWQIATDSAIRRFTNEWRVSTQNWGWLPKRRPASCCDSWSQPLLGLCLQSAGHWACSINLRGINSQIDRESPRSFTNCIHRSFTLLRDDERTKPSSERRACFRPARVRTPQAAREPRVEGCWLHCPECFSGRSRGKRITSRMEREFVRSMVRRSMPMPSPPVGGIP